MSSVHYFPRYSQRENAVTNNVLLLLSRLYEYRPDLLQAVLGKFIENDSIQVGPTIRQQQRIKKGTVPDAEVYQPSFRLIVETKTGSSWLAEQLIRHLNAFNNEDTQVLLLLSEEDAPSHVIDAVKAKIKTLQTPSGVQINVKSVTFDGLIRSIREVIDDRDFEMNDILVDFEAYASEEGLLPTKEFTLRTVPGGISCKENLELNLYYERADRGFRSHAYFGIYTARAIRHIGKVTKLVIPIVKDGRVVSFKSETGNNTDHSCYELSDDEMTRIVVAVQQAKQHSWNVSEGCRFTFVEKFVPTDFRKTSSGAARNARYFSLRTIIDDFNLQLTIDQIALKLSEKTWD
jgi:hypothetical protein